MKPPSRNNNIFGGSAVTVSKLVGPASAGPFLWNCHSKPFAEDPLSFWSDKDCARAVRSTCPACVEAMRADCCAHEPGEMQAPFTPIETRSAKDAPRPLRASRQH